MSLRPAVLTTSSRADGNTRALAAVAFPTASADFFELNRMQIGYYAYDGGNSGDDFLPLVEQIIDRDLWVLATPIYWYTMSAQAKAFVDRLSDLLQSHKVLGRRLRGKKFAVVCSGSDPLPPPAFDEPLRLTCQYLGMEYCGSYYAQFDGRTLVGKTERTQVLAFSHRIREAHA